MPGGWDWAGGDDLPGEDQERRALNSYRLARRLEELIEQYVACPDTFAVSDALICELHAIACANEPDAGTIRTTDNEVVPVQGSTTVLFQPPPWPDVSRHLAECYAYTSSVLARAIVGEEDDRTDRIDPVLHAAAYVLWRLNWIHPFAADGNGRTARAVAYLLLCVGFGQALPGARTVPELIKNNPYPYRDALRAADRAWVATGEIDVREMEQVLADAVLKQISS